jgi:hypothetical protein
MYGVSPMWLDGIGHDLMLDGDWKRALDAVLDWVDVKVPVGSPPLGPTA